MKTHILDFDYNSVPISEITARGVQSTPEFGLGRPIPVINIDLSTNPTFSTYLETHADYEGDVNYYWLKIEKHSSFVTLIIDVKAKVRAFAKIKFHKLKDIGTLEAIFAAEALAIQAGERDLPTTSNYNPKVIMSIPELGTFARWRPHAVSVLSKALKRDKQATRRNAKVLAQKLLDERRKLFFCHNAKEYADALADNPDHLSRLNSIAVHNRSHDD